MKADGLNIRDTSRVRNNAVLSVNNTESCKKEVWYADSVLCIQSEKRCKR